MKSISTIQQNKVHSLQDHIIDWYLQNLRDLPWRHTKDPYKILVSEFMLQQTQVNTVINYYKRFIDMLPTVYDLAEVDDEILMKLWEGLGYYRRARNLKKAAQSIVFDYNGQVPEEHKEILTLPGIGAYTSGAILSIAYNLPYAAVDGNVIRVYARLFKIEEEVNRTDIKKQLEELGQHLVSPNNPSAYNQGLMELGALICTPKNPKCLECPVISICKANAENIQSLLPRKQAKKKASKHKYDLCLIEKNNHLLVVKRSNSGILESQWSLPQLDRQVNQQDIVEWVKSTFDIDVKPKSVFGKETHVFTHRIWDLRYKQFQVTNGTLNTAMEYRWIPIDDLYQIPYPTAYIKILKNVYSTS